MKRDYKVDISEFLANNGFSGKYFVEHVKYMHSIVNRNSDIKYNLYRYKIVIERGKRKLVVKPHANGRSNKYATIFTGSTELFTFRYDLNPRIVMQVLNNYLA